MNAAWDMPVTFLGVRGGVVRSARNEVQAVGTESNHSCVLLVRNPLSQLAAEDHRNRLAATTTSSSNHTNLYYNHDY